MPNRFQNVHQNFAAGEVTPRMSMRVDHGAYPNALSRSQNFIISSQGGAVFREGFQYLGRPPSNQPFRLFQFHRGGDQSDLLIEVSEGVIRYWIDDLPDQTPYLFEDNFTLLTDEDDGYFLVDEDDGAFLTVGIVISSNPYSLDDLTDLYFTNQDKYGILLSPRHPPLYITVERSGAITATPVPVERIPTFVYQDTNNPGYVAQAADWRITFPVTWTDKGYLYFLTYNGIQGNYAVTGMGISYAFTNVDATNAANIEAGLTAAATRQGFTTTFAVTAIDNLTYDIAVTGDDSGWVVKARIGYWPYYVPGYSTGIIATDEPITQPNPGASDATEEPAWSYPTMVLNDPGTGDRYYRCLRVHRSVAASNEPGVGTEWEVYWEDLGIGVPDGFAYQYPDGNDWADGQTYAPWDRGFPTVGVFHDQRLILMANRDNPTALYGSALGYYFNFKVGPNDDDPFLYVLDSSDTPQIKWARSQNNLILGTSSGEWNVTANVTITPTDIHAVQQNNARSLHQMAVQVDTDIFYIEQGGRKLRVTHFNDSVASLTSMDSSLLAEHLIATHGVKRVVCSYIPEVFMVLLRNNGQPVFFTYEQNQPIVAFTDQLTDGTVYDAAAYFALNVNRDYTYYATQRNGNWVLERMRYPCSKLCTPLTANSVVHLDGWVKGTVNGTIITGLDHLEGREVAVLVDDAWQIGTYVVQAGQVTLDQDRTGRLYAVGLRYEGIGQTFEAVEIGRGETGLGTDRRWLRLFTRLLNSAIPQVESELSRDRTPSTPMGVAETIREGIQNVEQSVMGYGDGSLVFVQDRPYPTHILGFYGKYQIGDD